MRLFVLCLCLCLTGAVSSAAGRRVRVNTNSDPTEVKYELTVGGTVRTYYVYVPSSYTGARAFPLLVFFHGGSDSCTAETNFMIAGFTREQVSREYLFASPCGLGNIWTNSVDLPFAEALLDAVAHDYNVDGTRLYASGFSNGAGLTQYMGCRIPHRWTGGLAIAHGSMMINDDMMTNASNAQILQGCDQLFAQANAKVNVMKLQGGIDPYNLRYGRSGMPAARDDFYGWALRNGCKGSPTTVHDDNVFKDERFENCPTGVKVRLVVMNGIPHQWVQNATFNYNSQILDFYEIVAPSAPAAGKGAHLHPRARHH